jgi:hypothetical protein
VIVAGNPIILAGTILLALAMAGDGLRYTDASRLHSWSGDRTTLRLGRPCGSPRIKLASTRCGFAQ